MHVAGVTEVLRSEAKAATRRPPLAAAESMSEVRARTHTHTYTWT